MEKTKVSREKQEAAIAVIGGSTVVIDIGGLRLVTDPTFNPPGTYGPLDKLAAPAVDASELAGADVVLLSHDQHTDNFDEAGREYARGISTMITTRSAADRLTGAHGLAPGESTTLERLDGRGVLTVRGTPAVHGPLDAPRDEAGFVNGDVIGFVLSGDGLPTIYVSGDNASLGPVMDVAKLPLDIDVAVLFAGAARTSQRFDGRPLTLTSERAADAALVLDAADVVPAHYESWSIYSEGADDLRRAFDDAGIPERLALPQRGTWLPL